jgi:hypothetical protein
MNTVWLYMSYNLHRDMYSLKQFGPVYCHHNMYISSVHLGYGICFTLE